MDSFQQLFGFPAKASGKASGRVNLLGEHTDYNDGFVLPTAIPQQTTVLLAPSRDGRHHLRSGQFPSADEYPERAHPEEGFERYIIGCITVLRERAFDIPPMAVLVHSDVPIGAGLSSSAALEIALLRALRSLHSLPLNDVELARIGQEAETRFAHVRCGIMDQMAASLADTDHMLFIDTRSLERRLLPLPSPAQIVVLDCGVPRTLAASGYNERRAQCEEAARLLGVPALRDVDDAARLRGLPPLLQRRARHVLSENRRVLRAASAVGPQEFGELMNASHASLRDDYEVSIAALDALVGELQSHPSVFGARLTGAGFGGACVALVESGAAEQVKREVLAQYGRTYPGGTALV
jgi:galactokinase